MASPLRPGPKEKEILKDFEIIRELRLCVGKTEAPNGQASHMNLNFLIM